MSELRVRELRRLKGMSQVDLGRESGLRPDTISGLETGKHRARPSTLRKLAKALEVELQELFEEKR